MNLLLPSLAELTNSKFVVCRFFFSVFVQITGKNPAFTESLLILRPCIGGGMYNLTEDERKKLSEKQCVDHSAELHETDIFS